MDPVSAVLLAALAGGAGGEMGRQAWAALSALVRSPFLRGQGPAGDSGPATGTAGDSVVAPGERELAELERAPHDPAPAGALSVALASRAAVDADFRTGLEQWYEQAKLVRIDGEVHNSVSGGTFYGPTVLGRDFSGMSFTVAPPPPPTSPAAPGTEAPRA